MRSDLIPANSKKSMLYFSMFNKFDLCLFGTGILLSGLMMMILPIGEFVFALIALAPATITGFLVFPVPNYHNVLTIIISTWNFYTSRRRFIWKGWCVVSEIEKDDKQ